MAFSIGFGEGFCTIEVCTCLRCVLHMQKVLFVKSLLHQAMAFEHRLRGLGSEVLSFSILTRLGRWERSGTLDRVTEAVKSALPLEESHKQIQLHSHHTLGCLECSMILLNTG